MTSTARSCQAQTRSGVPCKASALANSDYCFTHDPHTADERRAARSKGGAARHGRAIGTTDAPAELVKVETTADIVQLIGRAINDALSLENSLNRARTIGYLALAACKALELDQLADRVAALEAILKARVSHE